MSAARRTCVLKIDVDTHRGLRDGLPPLLGLFRELAVPASIFVTMGPDNSGKAIRRVFTQRGFLRKMLRSGGPRMYGWRTILSGTVLPAPLVGGSFPDLLREAEGNGHEISIHAWDHVDWHDRLVKMDDTETRVAFGRAVEAYAKVFGRPPVSSAAPGWQATAASFRAQDERGILYHSDTRGTGPYFPQAGTERFTALEIPTTLPTVDELLGTATPRVIVEALLRQAATQDLCVFCGHTEVEGLLHRGLFRDLILGLRDLGFAFRRGIDVARDLLNDRAAIPAAGFRRGTVPRRGGFVTIQEPAPAAAAR